ncbi:MAG TPA: MBL fold metallo-hydrolase [Planctomycetota bacterium]|nr:MBL fold metallo-hydrolase [Planctomycetota bacterium]
MAFHTNFRFKPYKDEHGNLRPHPPAERIYGPISHIGPLTVCVYLVETSAGLVVVDSGYDTDVPLLAENIRGLGRDPRDIRLILLAHWHWDHAGGAAGLQQLSGAAVMIHEKDAEIVESGQYRGKPIVPAVRIAKRLVDGDVIALGGVDFKTIHCPGQSAGEVVFAATVDGLDGPCRALFASDATGFKHDVETLDFLGYPGVCADYRRTVEILRELEFDLYLGGHAHQVLNEARADGNPFITRDEWLKLVNGRHQAMEDFVREHPRYLDW